MNVQVDFLSRIFYILSKDYQNIDLLRNFLSEVKKYNLDVSDGVYKLFISKCPQYEILIMKYHLQNFDFQSLNEIIDYYYIYKHYYFRSKSFRESFDLLNYYLKLYEILIFALTTNKVKARAIKFICQNYAKIEDIYYLVYGFVDKNKNATCVKRYKTRSSARSVIQNMLKEDKFKQIVLKIEKRYLNKNNNWDFSSIEPEPHL